jgi:hypothetical protein
MTAPQFPLPDPKPLQLLNIYDGLTIDAACWKNERKYHQDRQNLHYRSLNQPGIVCGLGVRLMTAVEIEKSNIIDGYRDGRWVEIEPGIAIDLNGHPIVVDRPVPYQIKNPIDNPDGNAVHVYLYVSYSDAIVEDKESQLLDERYQIDQQTQPIEEDKIELCRILLKPGNLELYEAQDVWNPGENELDFRHRLQATWRSTQAIKVGLLVAPKRDRKEQRRESDLKTKDNPKTKDNLSYLMKAIEALYPKMQGVEKIDSIFIENDKNTFAVLSESDSSPEGSQPQEIIKQPQEIIKNYHLLYIGASPDSRDLNQSEIKLLRSYLQGGGFLFVEVLEKNAPIWEKLKTIIRDLDFRKNTSNSETSISKKEKQIVNKHPVLNEPFLFRKLPKFTEESPTIELWQQGNAIAIVGQLSSAWGRDLELDRSDIRTAHELGINLLYFARRHWQLIQCSQWNSL